MNKNDFTNLIQTDLTDEQFAQFQKFLTAYQNWNNKINISAIKTDEEIWLKHFADSCLGQQYLAKIFPAGLAQKKVLDLGTGGGFPLLPLSILNPQANFSGLDSVQKKLKVVQAMAEESGVKIPRILHGRAEELAQKPEFREKFDLVVTRAVAHWATLLELALPFVKLGGYFLAYQGPAVQDDLKKFANLEKKLGGKLEKVFTEILGENSRVFILIKKVQKTARQFPRKTGIPKKNPLT